MFKRLVIWFVLIPFLDVAFYHREGTHPDDCLIFLLTDNDGRFLTQGIHQVFLKDGNIFTAFNGNDILTSLIYSCRSPPV